MAERQADMRPERRPGRPRDVDQAVYVISVAAELTGM